MMTKKPIINIHSTGRIITGNVKVFGWVLNSETEEPVSAEVCLKVNGKVKEFLPQTRDGRFWFSLKLGFGLYRIRVCLWKFRIGNIHTIIESNSKWLLSLSKGRGCETSPWAGRLELPELYEKAKLSLQEIEGNVSFDRAYIVGRSLVRGWTINDIDIKLEESRVSGNTEGIIEKLTELNLLASKRCGYPVDFIISDGTTAYGHQRGFYDLSGCIEIRAKIYDNERGVVENPKREIYKYPGAGGRIYEEGESLTEEELLAVRNGDFVTRGEVS